MDVSIIGCVVNGPGEALVSTLGVTGGNKKSGLYEDGVRKDRLDNDDMIDQLERVFVPKPRCSMKPVVLTFNSLKQNNVLGSDTLPCMIEPAGARRRVHFCIYKENKRGKRTFKPSVA